MKQSKTLKNYTWRTGYGVAAPYPGGKKNQIVKSKPRKPATVDAAPIRLTNGHQGIKSGVGKNMTRGPKYPTSAT